jgi:hypothetical protein
LFGEGKLTCELGFALILRCGTGRFRQINGTLSGKAATLSRINESLKGKAYPLSKINEPLSRKAATLRQINESLSGIAATLNRVGTRYLGKKIVMFQIKQFYFEGYDTS